MIDISVNRLVKSFDLEKKILEGITFQIDTGERVGLLGKNGAGKTTLFRILTGELDYDEGQVMVAPDRRVGLISQIPVYPDGYTVEDVLRSAFERMFRMKEEMDRLTEQMAAGDSSSQTLKRYGELTARFEGLGGYDTDTAVNKVANGLSIDTEMRQRLFDQLSGGEKTRVNLGRLILEDTDILLLDEPTNHLDLQATEWLEEYIRTFRGTVVTISHDRYFLDRIASKIIEIDNTKVTVFSGNYSDYAAKKEQLRQAQRNAYLNQQAEIKHQEEVIAKLKQFNREKSIKRAESREKMLDKIEVVDKPVELNAKMNIKLEPSVVSGNDVLTVTDLTKSFDGNTLFNNINFEIKRGERVALIGNNGTGKTTILKLINGIIQPDSGSIYLGAKVAIGYYDQEHHVLDPDKTLFQEIQDAYPDLNNTQIRNTLAAFLFTDDDVFKYIRALSRGERGRVSLAQLLLSNATLLILAEPTNHLDIVSKEILENALNSYTGTILYVSHDRYFINATATRIIELSNRNIVNYIGNYDYYLEIRDILTAQASPVAQLSASDNTTKKDSTLSWQQSREEQNKLKKKQNEIKKTEIRIAEIEDRLSAIDTEYSDPSIGSNTARLMELHNESTQLKKELDELYEHWEELMDEI